MGELWQLYSPESTAANAVANCATSWPAQGQVEVLEAGSKTGPVRITHMEGDTCTNDHDNAGPNIESLLSKYNTHTHILNIKPLSKESQKQPTSRSPVKPEPQAPHHKV